MADMAGRLKQMERKLDFLMDHMRMKAVVSSGILGPDGLPTPNRVFEGSLRELYHLSRQLPTVDEAEFPIAPPIDAQTTGEDVI